METFDSSTFNSMTTAYSRANLVNETLGLFVMAIRREVMPTEFTFASILSSISSFGLPEQGMQIHCWVHKLGMEVDEIIATSLVDMYMKFGSVECAYKIFSAMSSKDLISWNTLIMGLAQNGQEAEGLIKFEELLIRGIEPDRITLLSVLFACCNAGMVCAGKKIFSSMEKEYGIKRGLEHYACIVEMVGRAGRLEEALEIMEAMPYKPNASILQCLLEAGTFYGNLSYLEKVAELMMMLEPQCSSPYLVLARIYERRRMWDSMARIVRTMEKKGLKRVRECSWIGIRNQVFTFSVDDLQHHGGEVMYSALHLLFWEIVNEDYVPGGFEDLRTMSKEDGLV
ncbi:hypothetical protein HPP92_002712 [Vanilla planifolia]|uniref:Pentatricopeptide repeat-containing protein n=1 Tax=Vanilla planifolia TaxID=51239 RepID=A0A835VIN0_VANPL|nr:hypothetical protein HPP92_003121 [Vanilla planifolia]KAG0502640.1 hypothetical protein HPP92_002712 [Vanilla planifolia]